MEITWIVPAASRVSKFVVVFLTIIRQTTYCCRKKKKITNQNVLQTCQNKKAYQTKRQRKQLHHLQYNFPLKKKNQQTSIKKRWFLKKLNLQSCQTSKETIKSKHTKFFSIRPSDVHNTQKTLDRRQNNVFYDSKERFTKIERYEEEQ